MKKKLTFFISIFLFVTVFNCYAGFLDKVKQDFYLNKGDSLYFEFSDAENAVAEYKKAADYGSSEAQHALGLLYLTGDGVSRNIQKGISFLQLAAESGSSDAQHFLGGILINGLYGVNRNLEDGINWIRESAENGNDAALFDLGLIFMGGIGVEKDSRKALMMFKQAEENGFPLPGKYKDIAWVKTHKPVAYSAGNGPGFKLMKKDIELVQRKLTESGFDPGPVDGIMGKKTSSALKQYQSEKGLVSDGKIGKQTLAHFKGL